MKIEKHILLILIFSKFISRAGDRVTIIRRTIR